MKVVGIHRQRIVSTDIKYMVMSLDSNINHKASNKAMQQVQQIEANVSLEINVQCILYSRRVNLFLQFLYNPYTVVGPEVDYHI